MGTNIQATTTAGNAATAVTVYTRQAHFVLHYTRDGANLSEDFNSREVLVGFCEELEGSKRGQCLLAVWNRSGILASIVDDQSHEKAGGHPVPPPSVQP